MRMSRLSILLAAVAIIGLIGAACGDASTRGTPEPTVGPTGAAATPSPTVASTAVAATATTVPTAAAATPTTVSTAVASTPTATAVPTAAASTPTLTPVPTATRPSRPDAVSDEVDGYLALAPAVLRSGQTEGISVSLFSGQQPARGEVRLVLRKDGDPVASAESFIERTGTVSLPVPEVPEGVYDLQIQGQGFEETASLRVEAGTVLFLETDKPIYKPGQDIHVRVLQLDPELKPLPGDVTVEVQDAKGIKVYREEVRSDDFGMASLTMPLSAEPNLGVWKVTAHSGEQETQIDVRVERYVLPKYEVDVSLPKEWVLAGEPIIGTVSAEYSFGKPVRGEVEIVASRYVGVWEEFATFTEEIDGTSSFELPPAQYAAGVPGSGGQGNLTLDVTVRERSTGYVESTTLLLTVAPSPVRVRLIPESPSFKPSLPFTLLLVTETPDNRPVERDVLVDISYLDEVLEPIFTERRVVSTVAGKALFFIDPPRGSVAVTLQAYSGGAYASLTLEASYSPSGSFIHVEQTSTGLLEVGDQARFRVRSTSAGRNFYYEVVSRGKVVFSEVSNSPDISFGLTPIMAPTSRLVVYQILPSNEVAADYIPFNVAARYPMEVEVDFGRDEASPGEAVDIDVTTQGPAKVGLAAVDRSVFILSENRLNLQQVFAELERLYMQPQVELHEARRPIEVTTRGARDTLQDAGLVVMSNMEVPRGKDHRREVPGETVVVEKEVIREVEVERMEAAAAAPADQSSEGLAEVQRVRQFFPETWLWADVMTDEHGRATVAVEAPDSITTWMLRAVALSQEHGLGVAEAELRVFQPFFLQVDLPYSAVRGEELPVKVALYNYLDSPQDFFVELEGSNRFELLDESAKRVTVGPSDVGGVEFKIRLTELGSAPLKVTARSGEAADAVVRELLVEPEGVRHETVDNMILSTGDSVDIDNRAPLGSIPGSARTYVALTGSYLSQTLEGLEGLLQMPFGCGEQNMILFAPNVFVARYLEETGQLKPEVMAKAEHLMITGYQRELTYRRADGSFSAFGDSDQEGSLWLTAFVLKTFAQAEGIIYMDRSVLDGAADWIMGHQRPDGSFEPVGFLHHQELLGGLEGNTALTAYAAIALLEAGERAGAASAIGYLESQLSYIDDPYTMAIAAYALGLGDGGRASEAYERLMSMAVQDENGLHWTADPGGAGRSTAVENTGYAVLALLEQGDRINAGSAARWLVSQRNAFGGFGSTQDTVVGLQALIQFATHARFDVDMTVTLTWGSWSKQVEVTGANADVVQIVDAPIGGELRISAEGSGEVVAQVVRRFNRPAVELQPVEMFTIDVGYSADHIEVDDTITVSAVVRFTPPTPIEAGMVVLDISVPTGFAPVTETIARLVDDNPKVRRYEVAGRKVILYIEDMAPEESIRLDFDAVARYPVRAQPVTSQVYSYYNPQWRGETLGQSVIVEGG